MPQVRHPLPPRYRHPPLGCATKEVPLSRELQGAPESPWTVLCEDALLAFEGEFWLVPFLAQFTCM